MTTATVAHPEGTLVYVTQRGVSGDPDIDREAAVPNVRYVVECYAGPGEGDDPNGLPYYLLDIPGQTYGGNFWAYPEHVDVVMTAEQAEARTVPTPQDIAARLASGMSPDAGFEIDGSDYSASNGVFEVYGETVEGLRFSACVQVVSVNQVD